MSLIEDALKRQEELRASSNGQNAEQPAKPRVSRVPIHRTNKAEPPPANPFLEMEKERPRHRASALYMPILAIVVFLALLFLKRELTDGKPANKSSKAEETIPIEIYELQTENHLSQSELPSENATATTISVTIDDNAIEGIASNSVDAVASTNHVASESVDSANAPGAIQEPAVTNVPAVSAVPGEPKSLVWPEFTLNGIALGKEKLAILNSGEMLTDGETAKCGVKVVHVDTSSVTFAWHGERKTLRKGEKSDKSADQAAE